MKYEFESLDEMANFLREKALKVERDTEKAIIAGLNQKAIHGMKIESITWLLAAEIVKDSIIKENGNE